LTLEQLVLNKGGGRGKKEGGHVEKETNLPRGRSHTRKEKGRPPEKEVGHGGGKGVDGATAEMMKESCQMRRGGGTGGSGGGGGKVLTPALTRRGRN